MTLRRITQQRVRDGLSILLGMGILIHQAFIVPVPSELLVLVGMGLLTGPAAGGVIGLRREAVTSGESSSPSSPSPSQRSSSSSVPGSGAGDPP